MLPVPAVARRAAAIAREHDCEAVLFGAAAPLGLITPGAAQGGRDQGGRAHPRPRGGLGGAARRPQAAAPHRQRGGHGHLPRRVLPGPAGPRAVCRRGAAPDGPAGARRGRDVLPPGRGRRRGQGTAGPGRPASGRLRVPDGSAQGPGHADHRPGRGRAAGQRAVLLLVGDGPYAPDLRAAGANASASPTTSSSPARSRGPNSPATTTRPTCSPCRAGPAGRGLDVEGLGIVYLEASATGLPVIGGDSGGAPDAILDGETGYVVSDAAGVARRDHRVARRSRQGQGDGGEGAGLGGPGVA